jgi:hypothetical protein
MYYKTRAGVCSVVERSLNGLQNCA